MKNNSLYITLLFKELKEQFLSSKLIIFVVVFLFFGLMSPISAMFMPDIMAEVSKSQNIVIELPQPTWIDAVGQYIKNLTQMSSFILIIIYMGIISREKETGTIVFLIVKPVPKSTFIIAKYSAVSIAALIGMTIAWLASSFYTFLFFENFNFAAFSLINLMMLVYVMVVLYVTVFFSSVFKSQIFAGIMSFVVYLLFNVLAQIDSLSKILPGGIIEETQNVLISAKVNWSVFIGSLVIMLVCVVSSTIIFRKWEP